MHHPRQPAPAGQLAPAAALLLLALALLAGAHGALAQQHECLGNPTLPACVNYTVHEAVLQADLSRLCAASALAGRPYSGWPAACTLWNECQEGRGSGAGCAPLALIQTACGEALLSPGTLSETCLTYTMLCAPQSVVAQCAEQPPIEELRPAVQHHAAVQKLCTATNSTGNGAAAGSGDAAGRVGADAAGRVGANAAAAGSSAAAVGADAGGRVGTDAAGRVAAQGMETAAVAPAACRNCSSLSFNPDKVTVQALEANCPDPLGTLAILCLNQSSGTNAEGCAGWADFCASEAGLGFPSLCGGSANGTDADGSSDAGAPSPASSSKVAAAPSPSPAEPASPAALKGPDERASAAGAAEVATCYADPSQESCRAFQHTDLQAEVDIRQLCGSVPSLVGCSLWQQCSSGAAAGSYCQPFSVLGSICLPNPGVAGCQRWAAVCDTAGSVVQQCITAAPVRNVLMTSQTMDVVVKACSSPSGAGVSGCQQCSSTAGWNGCRDPLAVMGQLCAQPSAASLPQCSKFAAMCEEAGATFTALCSSMLGTAASNGTTGSTASADSKMYLHASMSVLILFQSWVPTSGGAYVASCLAVVAMAFVVQALKAWSLQLEARWSAQRAHAASAAAIPAVTSPGCSSPAFSRSSMDGKDARRSSNIQAPMLWRSSLGRLISSGGSPRHPQLQQQQQRQPCITRQEFARNAARSVFTGAVVWLDYMLVLVVMTFNLGLIISATLGFCLGSLAFGHVRERVEAASASRGGPRCSILAGSLHPTSDNDVEVQYFAPQLPGAAAHAHPHPQQQHHHLPPLPPHQPPIVSIQ